MTRFRLLMVLVVVGVVLAGLWIYGPFRQIDGRTATAWLDSVQHASQTVSYEAAGYTVTQGQRASFTLQQGTAGRYSMQVADAQGRRCTLGYDGTQAWYRSGERTTRTAGAVIASFPREAGRRLLGTSTVAGRAAVLVRVQQGAVRKDLAVDRETGVILGMTTWQAKRETSRMQVQRIDYHSVTVASCRTADRARMRQATDAQVAKALQITVKRPQWLPTGVRARGTFLQWCDCCQQEMATVRYTDGLRTVTLFQAPGAHVCAMSNGCQMAPSGTELVETRRLGKVTIIAVGNVERATLRKMLDSLQ